MTAKRSTSRRGNAVLETALVLPVLLMLALGSVEYGYFFYVKSALQGAARSGARAAIVPGATTDDVESAVSASMSASGFGSGRYSTSCSGLGLDAGSNVSVTVSGAWSTIGVRALPTMLGGISSGKQVRGSATMRKE